MSSDDEDIQRQVVQNKRPATDYSANSNSSSDEDILHSVVQKKRYLVEDDVPVPRTTRIYQQNKQPSSDDDLDELPPAPQAVTDDNNAVAGTPASSDEIDGQDHVSSFSSSSSLLADQDEPMNDDEDLIALLTRAHMEEPPPVNEATACGESVEAGNSEEDRGRNDNIEDDEDDEDDEEDENRVGEQAIAELVKKMVFENSPHTVDEAVLMVMDLYVNNHNVSKKLLGQVASVVHMLLPQPNSFPSSKFRLFSYLKKNAPINYQAVIHHVCKKCEYYKGLKCDVENTKCQACGSEEVSDLIVFPLDQVVKHLFEVRHLAKVLSKQDRTNSDQQCLRDITDGRIYKSFKNRMGPHDITLLWNCDGVSTSDSSTAQLWPLQCTICEIPFVLRKHYLFVCGFFFGGSKPVLNSFLRPFVMSLRKISEEGGVKWTDPSTREERSSVVRAPFASMDAPARGQGLNMTLLGYFGCGMCVIEGEVVFHKRGTKVVYPTEGLDAESLRTAQSFREQALRATRAHPVNGLYGPNIIMFIPRFDPARGLPNEYMHGTCLGVAKTFTGAWTDDTRGDWYIAKSQRALVSAFLRSIFPPDTVKRTPKDLESSPQWKASEWRIWLLIYSPIALLEVWPRENKYYQHWILLVKAIHNLVKDEITEDDIEEAKELLNRFLKEIRDLYSYRDPENRDNVISGKWLYTYNVHQLVHLPNVTEDTGPLPATSAFVFEDNNGKLKNLIHGTNKVDKELLNSLQILESIRVLRRKVEESKLADIVEGRNRADVMNEVIVDFGDDELVSLRSCAGRDVEFGASDCSFFARATLNGEGFASIEWDRPEKRNSFTVRCASQSGVCYGEIMYFVKIIGSDKIFFMLKLLRIQHTRMIVHRETRAILKHILPIKLNSGDEKVGFALESERQLCKIIRAGNYLCLPPNKIEINL